MSTLEVMMKIAIVAPAIALLLLVALAGPTAAEPTGFSDIPWGTHRQEARERCGRPNRYQGLDGTNSIYCEGRPVVLGKAGPATAQLLFDEAGGLSGYLVMPGVEAYSALRAEVLDKLGKPYKEETVSYTTKDGERVTGEVMTWLWASGAVAHLQQLCGRVDRSCLTVMTKTLVEQRKREHDARPKRPAKQF